MLGQGWGMGAASGADGASPPGRATLVRQESRESRERGDTRWGARLLCCHPQRALPPPRPSGMGAGKGCPRDLMGAWGMCPRGDACLIASPSSSSP